MVEHARMKSTTKKYVVVEPNGEMLDHKIKVFYEYARHLVQEEQGEMFLKVSHLNLMELGNKIPLCKQNLLLNELDV